jgi:hypothetical protein
MPKPEKKILAINQLYSFLYLRYLRLSTQSFTDVNSLASFLDAKAREKNTRYKPFILFPKPLLTSDKAFGH